MSRVPIIFTKGVFVMGRCIGIDADMKALAVMEISPDGTRREYEVPFSEKGLQFFEARLRPDDHIALEASLNSYFLYDRFVGKVAKVSLANPMKLKMISKNPAKNDRNDAGKIAALAYLGYLPEIWVPDRETREDREIVQHRCTLVKDQTRVKNRIRSHLGKYGIVCTSKNLLGRDAQRFLQSLMITLTPLAQDKLQSLLREMDMLEKEIQFVEKIVDTRADRCPEIDSLMSISGMNTHNAFAIRAVIGDISRFPRPECLANYAGMVPKMRASGNRSWSGHISKAGSKILRWAITETVQSLVRQPGSMKTCYRSLLRSKSRGTAITACGRKLLEIIWHMLTKKTLFRDTRPDLYQRKQSKRAARPRHSLPTPVEVLPSFIEHLTVLRELAIRSS